MHAPHSLLAARRILAVEDDPVFCRIIRQMQQ